MSIFENKKQKRDSNSGDTWGQVFADIRNVLGLSRTVGNPKPDPKATDPEPAPIKVEEEQATDSDWDTHEEKPEIVQESPSAATSDMPPPEQSMTLGRITLRKRFVRLSWRKKALVGVGVIVIIVAGVFREEIFAPRPPSPDVVATFNGGQVTLEDVRQHLATLGANEAEQQELRTPRGYEFMVNEMITDELVRRWSENRNPESDKDFSHVMKHITEEVNLDELHTQMHKGQLGVTESDIQAYYEANKAKFGDKTLTDVRDQIKTTLQGGKEDQFVQNYITGLKNKSSITRDFSVLAVPEPSARELTDYYAANQKQYVKPAQASVQTIRIPKGTDEKKAKAEADKALATIRSGGDFAVAAKSAQGALISKAETVFKENKDSVYEEAIFRLDTGGVSDILSTDDSFIIAKLISKEPERQLRFDEVRAQILPILRVEKEKKHFADNADRTLFTVNGTRFTAGEFSAEYEELPAAFLAQYQGTKGKQDLIEKIIERTLLYEDSLSQVSQADTKEKKDEMRLKVLAQMFEQEEVDEKITIADSDIEVFYKENRDKFVKPPKSKIRQIAIKTGETDDDHTRAEEKVKEAYEKLESGFLKKGQDFSAVAKEYSEDEETKNAGGDVSAWVEEENDPLGELTGHPYHELIASLEKGEVSQPFEWEGYFYIVQVSEREEGGEYPLDEAKEYIKEYLTRQKHDELAYGLSKKLLKDADVVIYSRTLRRLGEEAQ